ncbi:hypothetical protein [Corynebacterium kroppenstedtii]
MSYSVVEKASGLAIAMRIRHLNKTDERRDRHLQLHVVPLVNE